MRADLFARNTGIIVRSFGLALGLALLLGACRKDETPCAGSCSVLQAEGVVYDRSTNRPLSGQSVSITLNENPYCLPCATYKLASGLTDNTGHFQLSYSLDTNLLRYNRIIVSVPLPSNYILFPVLKDSFTSNMVQSAYTRYFGLGNMDSMQNMKFGFYPVAPLHVNLHRASTIVPQNPYLSLYVNIDGSNVLSSLLITQTEANKDTSFVINTTPNLFTKINWNKYTTATTVQSATDSIICKPAANNALDIYY